MADSTVWKENQLRLEDLGQNVKGSNPRGKVFPLKISVKVQLINPVLIVLQFIIEMQCIVQ